jgi:hypothetical protein
VVVTPMSKELLVEARELRLIRKFGVSEPLDDVAVVPGGVPAT